MDSNRIRCLTAILAIVICACEARRRERGEEAAPTCRLNAVEFATLQPIYLFVGHGQTVEIRCNKGYHLDEQRNTRVTKKRIKCMSGNWEDEFPEKCIPDSCLLAMHEGSIYFTESEFGRQDIKEESLITHETTISTQCSEGYYLVSLAGIRSVLPVESVVCQLGGWTNVHRCKKRQTCSAPEEMLNAELKPEFHGKDTFEEGDKVAYNCQIGYSISGTSRERECREGSWTDVQFDCDIIRCPYIPNPENGRRLDSNNAVGQSTRFACNPGFRLIGPSQITCRIDGDWLPSQQPKCDYILCPELRNLQNGRIFQDSRDGVPNNYQSVAEYTCNYGYTINGTNSQNARRQCQADGTWDGYDYFCDILRCEPIKEFYGGLVKYFGREERAAGSYAVYDCAHTYCLHPKITRSECRKSDLSWLPVPPKCFKKLEIQCPINNECTGQKSLCQDESIKIKCERGFELYSQKDDLFLDLKEMTVVNDNGTAVVNQRIRVSQEALPLCVEERCDPGNLQHVNVSEKKRSGTAVRLDCENGYEFSPRVFGRVGIFSEEMICRSGRFYYREKEFQGCEERSCTFDGYISNSQTVLRDRSYPNSLFSTSSIIPPFTWVQILCKEPTYYELVVTNNMVKTYPSEFMTTCRFGMFYENQERILTENFPVCQEKRCDSSVLKHTVIKDKDNNVVSGMVTSGTVLDAICEDKYEFQTFRQLETVVEGIRCERGKFYKNTSYFTRTSPVTKCIEKTCLFKDYPANEHTIRQRKGEMSIFLLDEEIISHGETIIYKCQNEEYELYINSSQKFIGDFSALCRFGNFDVSQEEFPVCIGKRCDIINQRRPATTCYHTDIDGSACRGTNFKIHHGELLYISCLNGYEIADGGSPESVIQTSAQTQCFRGKLKTYSCVPKRCDITSLPRNSETKWTTTKNIEADSRYLGHGETVEVFCKNDDKYELYVESTETYLVAFKSTCSHGTFDDIFPACVEKRCSLLPKAGVCYEKKGISDSCDSRVNVLSGSPIRINIQEGYKLYANEKLQDNSVSVECSQGKLKKEVRSIPVKIWKQMEDFADKTNFSHIYLLEEAACRFSIQSSDCKDSCLVPSVSNGILQDIHGVEVTKLVKHNERVLVGCENGFRPQNNEMITCNNGLWEPQFNPVCIPKPCNLVLEKGEIITIHDTRQTGPKQMGLYFSGSTLLFECEDGYTRNTVHTGEDTETNEQNHTSICQKGSWSPSYSCSPNPCSVPQVPHASVQPDVTSLGHSEKLQITCHDGYHFSQEYDKEKKTGVIKKSQDTICRLGRWKSGFPDKCHKDSCVINPQEGSHYDITDDTSGRYNISEGGLIPHDKMVNLTCSAGYDLATCNLGVWQNVFLCNDSFRENKSGSDEEIQTPPLSVEKDYNTFSTNEPATKPEADKSTSSGLGEGVITYANNNEGCRVPSRRKYKYADSSEAEQKPGTLISDGVTLTVTCRVLDYYDRIISDNNYDMEEKNQITCTNGHWNDINLDCQEGDSEQCLTLANGKVEKWGFDEYKVSCNEGYVLNLFRKEEPYCKCADEGLICKYGNQTPSCEPESCKVPRDFDDRITVFVERKEGVEKKIVYLSGGIVVSVGDIVFFDCKNTGGQYLEPVNRRFKCINGKWLEAEKDQNWKLGHNGTFPDCRNASCHPICNNNGECIKDGLCKCPHLTSGERCEEMLCDTNCKENGGECIAPGKCGNCPSGRYGVNCELRGCLIPRDLQLVSPVPDWIEIGRRIAATQILCKPGYKPLSTDEMICQQDGKWTHNIQCEEMQNVQFRIQIKTGSHWQAGTSATVYVYLEGDGYRTKKLTMRKNIAKDILTEEEVTAADITPIKNVKVGRESVLLPDDWQVEYVAVVDLTHQKYYMFKRKYSFWVDDNRDEDVPLFATCDLECIDNGGMCSSSNSCDCPAGRHGMHCRERGCPFPSNAPIHIRIKNIFEVGEIIHSSAFRCSSNERPSPPSMMCLNSGSWTTLTRCMQIPEIKYVVQVAAADSSTNVYVQLHGENGMTTRQMYLGYWYNRNTAPVAEENFYDTDVTPIRYVTIGHKSPDSLKIHYVSVFIDFGGDNDQFYVFGEYTSVWIQGGSDKQLELSSKPSKCVHGFKRSFLYPTWTNPNNVWFSLGKGFSERSCKQTCLLQKDKSCVGVFFDEDYRICWVFEKSDKSSFIKNENNRTRSDYYERHCF